MIFKPSSFSLLAILFAPVLLLGGCAALEDKEEADKRTEVGMRHSREDQLQSRWRGRSYHALLQAYGAPKMVMSVPGYRPLNTSVIVFGVIDRKTNCIDAFTVVSDNQNGDMTVADYFCR